MTAVLVVALVNNHDPVTQPRLGKVLEPQDKDTQVVQVGTDHTMLAAGEAVPRNKASLQTHQIPTTRSGPQDPTDQEGGKIFTHPTPLMPTFRRNKKVAMDSQTT